MTNQTTPADKLATHPASAKPTAVLAAIAGLLNYSMADAGWDFNALTDAERSLVGSPEVLERIRQWAAHHEPTLGD